MKILNSRGQKLKNYSLFFQAINQKGQTEYITKAWQVIIALLDAEKILNWNNFKNLQQQISIHVTQNSYFHANTQLLLWLWYPRRLSVNQSPICTILNTLNLQRHTLGHLIFLKKKTQFSSTLKPSKRITILSWSILEIIQSYVFVSAVICNIKMDVF